MARLLGLGNALLDIIVPLEGDGLLHELGLEKGAKQYIDIETLDHALETIAPLQPLRVVGGSAVNIVRGISRLGMGAGFVGKVGRDEAGRLIRDEMIRLRINPMLHDSLAKTGCSMALISPDGTRTFATFLGAAATLNAHDLNANNFLGYDILHIEGYIVQNRAFLSRVLVIARENQLMVSLDLSNADIVDRNREFLHRIIPQSVDILFTNSESARAFTGKSEKNALFELSSGGRIAVIRMGHHGAMGRRGEESLHVPCFKAAVVDGTGASDLFVSGCLYGILSGWSLAKSLELGNYVAHEVIQSLGTHLSDERWVDIRARASQMAG
ncbi:MAG: adenosine kinase [Bacteroidia bacterium]|nr:MAG: adenosine kinase [Bacteroidia bacterium]